jgi:hypothetical protein
MNTPLTILLILVVLGGIVVLLDHLPTRTETLTISGRGLADTAATSSAAMADPTGTVIAPGAPS